MPWGQCPVVIGTLAFSPTAVAPLAVSLSKGSAQGKYLRNFGKDHDKYYQLTSGLVCQTQMRATKTYRNWRISRPRLTTMIIDKASLQNRLKAANTHDICLYREFHNLAIFTRV